MWNGQSFYWCTTSQETDKKITSFTRDSFWAQKLVGPLWWKQTFKKFWIDRKDGSYDYASSYRSAIFTVKEAWDSRFILLYNCCHTVSKLMTYYHGEDKAVQADAILTIDSWFHVFNPRCLYDHKAVILAWMRWMKNSWKPLRRWRTLSKLGQYLVFEAGFLGEKVSLCLYSPLRHCTQKWRKCTRSTTCSRHVSIRTVSSTTLVDFVPLLETVSIQALFKLFNICASSWWAKMLISWWRIQWLKATVVQKAHQQEWVNSGCSDTLSSSRIWLIFGMWGL